MSCPAGEALGLGRGEFLHAGPPITWERASGPLRGALTGAAIFEGLTGDADASDLAGLGITSLEPCHHRGAVGPMAGVVSASMWMFVLEDPADGRRSYCSLNEGLGQVLQVRRVFGRGDRAAQVDEPRARAAAPGGGPPARSG